MKKGLVIFLALALLTGCSKQQAGPTAATTPTPLQGEKVNTQIDLENLFSDRDQDPTYTESGSAVITLSGTSASCSSNAVQISGSTVTITDEGTYILRGNLDNGQIIVNADKADKTQLVLEGVNIQSQTGAALYILQADKVFVTLAEGTENTLSNGGSFTATDDNNVDGAVFSKEDVTLNGKGSLTVTSPAGHGIVSKDELTVTGGSYTVNCASHGFAGKDSVAISDGDFTITAGKDGIHGENNDDTTLGYVYIAKGNFTISAEGDGISASNSLQIDGGTFDIVTGGGSVNGQKPTSDNWGGMGGFGGPGGMGGGKPGKRDIAETTASTEDSTSIKGIKAAGDLVINEGSFTLDCADDALHSNANLTVTGGTITIATGDDGFHADETLTVTGSTVNITESYEGLEGLHIKMVGGDITLAASDDGLNAAGGTDESGFGGIREDQFGGFGGGRPGMGGPGMSAGNGSIVISGGKLNITASGDGIDANGTLEITGGNTVVCGPTRGDTATLDYDSSAVISGGTFIGTGASGMAQTFSETKQGVIALQLGNQAADTPIKVTDSQGKVLIEHTPALDYAVVILSCPEMVKGQSYTLTFGTQSQTVTAN